MPSQATVDVARGRAAAAREAHRRALRERIHRKVVHPIDQPRAVHDPFAQREASAFTPVGASRLLVIAVAGHVAVIALLAAVSALTHSDSAPEPERVRVRVIQQPPERPEPEPVAELAPVAPQAPEFEEPPPEPPAPEPPPAEPPPPVERRRTEPEPPPSEADPAPPTPSEPMRIPGLSLESTVGTGNGPAFATGSTRLGMTARVAQDPQTARSATGNMEPRPTPTTGMGAAPRQAARIPTRDATFERPRRLAPVRPPYPAQLRAQGVEGDVMVRVALDAEGQVESAEIVRSSGESAFDETALRSARQERFSPARRDGVGVRYSLTYSYRFRVDR